MTSSGLSRVILRQGSSRLEDLEIKRPAGGQEGSGGARSTPSAGPSQEPGWARAAAWDRLLEANYRGSRHEVKTLSRHAISVYGAQRGVPDSLDGRSELSRVEEALRALGDTPQLEDIREIHVVDDLGHFLDPDGGPKRSVRALPPDERGRMLVARAALSTAEDTTRLFADHVNRERRMRVGESCQVRDRTILAQVRVAALNLPLDEGDTEHGTYQGRPIIGRDSRITGGVYLSGSGKRPAIVVDPSRDRRLDATYDALRKWIPYWTVVSKVERGRDPALRVLGKVYALVCDRLPLWPAEERGGRSVDDAVIAAIRRRGHRVGSGQKIYLGEYLRIKNGGGRGGGECVHQSLLAGHLLERLHDDAVVAGRVSFERNQIRGLGTHAWVRFTSARGRVYVLDATQGYLGPVDSSSSWLYMREEDIRHLRSQPL